MAKNLKKLNEGLTVSYAKGRSLKPFIPFSKDSSGCINSLFYKGKDRDNGEEEGDIFIDCSYTKFFLEMKEKGTYYKIYLLLLVLLKEGLKFLAT